MKGMKIMFGNKKQKPIRAMHYEGLKDFTQDFPCTIEIEGDNLLIKRIKPESTVTLPLKQILAIDVMEEERYMLKYHQDKSSTTKAKGISKYYMVIRYESKEGSEKFIGFWGTASEYGKFLDLQKVKMNIPADSYSL